MKYNKKALNKTIYEYVNETTPVYELYFVTKNDNKEYHFASFYGKTFVPKRRDTIKTMKKISQEQDKEIYEEISKTEQAIQEKFVNEGLIKNKLKLKIKFEKFVDPMVTKMYDFYTAIYKSDALGLFKNIYENIKNGTLENSDEEVEQDEEIELTEEANEIEKAVIDYLKKELE